MHPELESRKCPRQETINKIKCTISTYDHRAVPCLHVRCLDDVCFTTTAGRILYGLSLRLVLDTDVQAKVEH